MRFILPFERFVHLSSVGPGKGASRHDPRRLFSESWPSEARSDPGPDRPNHARKSAHDPRITIPNQGLVVAGERFSIRLPTAVRRFDQEKGWNIMAGRLCRENHPGQVERSRAPHLCEPASLLSRMGEA